MSHQSISSIAFVGIGIRWFWYYRSIFESYKSKFLQKIIILILKRDALMMFFLISNIFSDTRKI